MREYELTYLISDEVLEKDLNKVTGKVSEIISSAGGKVKKEEIWGRRKLSYPIQKQNFANYVTLWIELEGEKVAEINHELQVLTGVIRHLLITKADSKEKITVTKQDVIADEELEKIIGEKGVEIVKGETEESYELMAKRETEIEKDKIAAEVAEEVEKKETEIKTKNINNKEKESDTKDKTEKPKKEKKSEITKTKDKKTTPKADKPKKKEKEEVSIQKKDTNEVDRIKKLDEKLDELLGDDI